MRAFVALPALADGHTRVRGILGERWLERKVDAAREAMQRRNNLSPSMIGMTQGKLAHPLVSEAYLATDATGALTGETLMLDLLELDLQALEGNLPENLTERLRVETEAAKVMYEVHVAAGLARLGWPLRWVADSGGRRPEMIVAEGTDRALSVECKKRDESDGYEKETTRFWHDLQFKLKEKMTSARLNYAVKITADQFRLGDVDRVVKDILDALQSSTSGAGTVGSGYTVEFSRLAEPGGSIPSHVLDLFPRGVYGVNHGQVLRRQLRGPRFAGDRFTEGPVQDPIVLRLELADDPLRRVNGVLRNLKHGAKQLDVGLPGALYIDVSLGTYNRESVEFDGIAHAVREQLERSHTRVSAVMLTALEPTKTLDGTAVWWIRTEMIVQPRPQHPLSDEVTLPGSEQAGQWIPGKWFTVR